MCYEEVEAYGMGKGLAECEGCAYRFACGPKEEVPTDAQPKFGLTETDEAFIARLRAKVAGKRP